MSRKEYADSVIVDEHDVPVGQMQLPEAYKNNHILRVARVYLYNSSNEILLQQRGPKVLSPGLWCESASGHVDAGESYETTAVRELEEELGVSGLELTFIETYFHEERGSNWTARRFNTVYAAQYEGDVMLSDLDEVSGYRWVDAHSLQAEVLEHPARFTCGFKVSLDHFLASNVLNT